MANSKSAHIHIFLDGKFPEQDGWQLDDISLCSSGNIAFSGHNYNTPQSFVCIYSRTAGNSDSRDKPTLLYHRQFTHIHKRLQRHISFKKSNLAEIVTCRSAKVDVIDYNRDVILRSIKVNGSVACLSVSKTQIFIGLRMSNIVNIYDNDLNRIKSIELEGFGDVCLRDLAAADRLYVCTTGNDARAIACSQDSGTTLTEYSTGPDYSRACSITVNKQHQILAVLWDLHQSKRQVAVYPFNNSNCLNVFDVESGVSRIRMSDQGRIVAGCRATGKVTIFELAQLFTYDNFKLTVIPLLSENDLKGLLNHFNMSDNILKDDSAVKGGEKNKAAKKKALKGTAKRVFRVLEKERLLQNMTSHQWKKAFSHLGGYNASMVMCYIDLCERLEGEVRATEMSVAAHSGPSDNIAESLTRGSMQSQSNSAGANTVVKQINQFQSNLGKPLSQKKVPALLPRPGRERITESSACSTGKRGNTEDVYFAGDNRLHGKRAKVSGDSQGTSVSTPEETHGPVTQPPMVQTSPSRDLQSILSQCSNIPCLQLLSSPQPECSVGIQQSGSFTELHSPNQVSHNGQLQVRQQEVYPGASNKAQQVVTATRDTQLSPYSQTGRHSQNEPLLQTAEQSSRSQMGVKVTQNEDSDSQQTENHINFRTSQQGKLFLDKEESNVTQSLGQQIMHARTDHIEHNFQQCKNTIELQNAERDEDDVGFVLLERTQMNNIRKKGKTEHELHMAEKSDTNTQKGVQHTARLALPSDILQQDLSDGELQTRLEVREYESIPASSHVVCEQMLATAQSPFQRHHTNVLKDIHEKLGCLFSSSKSHHLQETPGTSLLSRCKGNVSGYSAEYKHGAITYLESLDEEEKNSLLAFKDMSDDREELARRLVEQIFTGEERKDGNTSGTVNFQKLNEDKLQRIRCVVFYLCPIRTRKQFSDKLQDKEWKRLCEVIDTANRHYRQQLKRQAKRKERLPTK